MPLVTHSAQKPAPTFKRSKLRVSAKLIRIFLHGVRSDLVPLPFSTKGRELFTSTASFYRLREIKSDVGQNTLKFKLIYVHKTTEPSPEFNNSWSLILQVVITIKVSHVTRSWIGSGKHHAR